MDQTEQSRSRPRVSFVVRTLRWTMRLVVVFLFLQLGLWAFVGRNSLIQLAPEMISADVRSVASMASGDAANSRDYSERVYIISQRLADAIGDQRMYELERSLQRFNGTLVTEDDRTYVARANQDGCGNCLFVGIRQTLNTPFIARSYTSYSRPLVFTQMHGIDRRTREREHTYIWLLGRWVHVSDSWLTS